MVDDLDSLSSRQQRQLRVFRRVLWVLGALATVAGVGGAIVILLPTRTIEERIVEAVERGQAAEVRALLAREPGYVRWRDRLGVTLLHRAARDGHVEIVELLLEHGADPLARGLSIETTPLHLAAGRGRVRIIERLLEAGTPVDVRAANGSTPLHTAAHGGEADAAALLLRHGADVMARTADGLTPLHAACLIPRQNLQRAGQLQVAAVLLEAGADLHAVTDQERFTPLHTAVLGKRYDMIGLLLQQPVDLDAVDHLGRTPLAMAREFEQRQAAEGARLLAVKDWTAIAQRLEYAQRVAE